MLWRGFSEISVMWNYHVTLEGLNIIFIIGRSSSWQFVNIACIDFKANHLTLYKAKVTLCSEILTEHINIVCGQNVDFLDVEPCDM